MNDLNGLDWSSTPGTGRKFNASSTGNANYSAMSGLKPTPPVSGRVSPAVTSQSAKSAAGDSFSNLIAFGNGSNKNVSLQEQQKRLAESKLQQLVGQKQKLQSAWAGNDEDWNALGSGRSTPATAGGTTTSKQDEDDLFAAFNQPPVTKPAVSSQPFKPSRPALSSTKFEAEDDDPFGLSEFQAKHKTAPPPKPRQAVALDQDFDDILGDLGRPVSQRPPQPPRQATPEQRPSPDHPQDKAVAELVDMGFPAGKARRALEQTETGMNVQAAVGILLNQAHEEARQKTKGVPAQSDEVEAHSTRRARPRAAVPDKDVDRTRSATPSADVTKTAQELGTVFMKSAGALWKTAQKSVQQAVSEFNSDSESSSNQPKWMKEVSTVQSTDREGSVQRRSQKIQPSATDEAMMLETERPTPPPQQRQTARSRIDHSLNSSADVSRDHSPAVPSRLRDSHSPKGLQRQPDPLAGMMRPRPQAPPITNRAALNKQAAEDQASQAYTSSARRRKPATPGPAPAPALEGRDLLDGSFSKPSQQRDLPARPASQPQGKTPIRSTPVVNRPAAPKRNIPPIAPLSLKASHTARIQGNEHFKRGDYSSAHELYSTALRHVPAQHTLQLLLLTNRALTALKTGQPKLTITDADAAILLIGSSKGEDEVVDLLDGESAPKPMRDYYGKALMRKAEALENLEKWSEASLVWKQAVEDGHGGATAIQGRARAEKAAAPKPAIVKRPKTAPPRTTSQKPAAAVNALRAQNQAAEKLDDEKFALADIVSARIANWKNGKEGNLRALLASLDTVLWDGAGWRKIGMADLVLPNKVKIQYMKGIGKCHPDKVSDLLVADLLLTSPDP